MFSVAVSLPAVHRLTFETEAMSLVASKDINPLEGDAPDINDGGAKITSGDFWPEVKLADIRREMRLNGLVTTDRLMHMGTEAVITVNRQLTAWMAEQKDQGYSSLAEVPSEDINSSTVLMFRYRRAVFCIAKALLTEGYRDFDTTGQG